MRASGTGCGRRGSRAVRPCAGRFRGGAGGDARGSVAFAVAVRGVGGGGCGGACHGGSAGGGDAGGRASSPREDPDWRAVAGADPLASWREVRGRMMAALTPEALDRRVGLAIGVEMTMREWLERYPLELLVHTWDLAQATGQRVVFDADLVGPALETAERMAPRGREVGMVGPAVAVPDDADGQARLLALFGRSPGAAEGAAE
ncbi:maleylpyruvate isomerase N-terminal domain-containing protein [Actinomadura madurae]|nr:maleylpyruvate isomerase N-terminal domain-containing protein [Actinomadura madurae]